MFPFLAVFIIFLLITNYLLRRQNHEHANAEQQFWDRELESNNIRRQDISKLDYIIIPLEKIPQNLGTESEKTLVELSSCRMLNLLGQTNTDLKMQYGIANLEELSAYEANFVRFVSVLPVYTKELADSGQADAARGLLEFAVDCRADSSQIYLQLAGLYQTANEPGRIPELIESARALDTISGRITVNKLTELLGDAT